MILFQEDKSCRDASFLKLSLSHNGAERRSFWGPIGGASQTCVILDIWAIKLVAIFACVCTGGGVE